jgi:hypothetical protein
MRRIVKGSFGHGRRRKELLSCEPVPSIVISVTSSKFAMSASPTVTATLSPLITTVSPAAEGFTPFCHPAELPHAPDAPVQTHSAPDRDRAIAHIIAKRVALRLHSHVLLVLVGLLMFSPLDWIKAAA